MNGFVERRAILWVAVLIGYLLDFCNRAKWRQMMHAGYSALLCRYVTNIISLDDVFSFTPAQPNGRDRFESGIAYIYTG